MTVRRIIDGIEQRRTYSICAPAGGQPRIGVREVPRGAFSGWLVHQVSPGDDIDVQPPAGSFIADPDTKGGHTRRCRVKIDQIGAGRNAAKVEGAIGGDGNLHKSIQPAAGNDRSRLQAGVQFGSHVAADFSSQLPQKCEVDIVCRRARADVA